MDDVLRDCEKFAEIGYKIAFEQKENLKLTLTEAETKVKKTLSSLNRSPCKSPALTDSLREQLSNVEKSLQELSYGFQEDLDKLKRNMSKFSIVLFGRTMAGKSTLMEILTNGNGESIGKGAQRTTRDVRKYNWKELEIVDVPGIGAFNGEEDERIAFEAAKTGDLILFLMTDDAPQAEEAKFFHLIVDLGKPIICVLNVKAGIDENKSARFAEKTVKSKFDKERLKAIREQFISYAEKYKQSWKHILFVDVHLQSAYLSKRINDTEKAKTFYQLSQISFLENKILEIVTTKGKFYRIKNFVDIITNPMLASMEDLFSQSCNNYAQAGTVSGKQNQLIDWKQSFRRDGIARIKTLIRKIKSELNTEIASFAEDHFDDKDADKAWKKTIEMHNIQQQCENLLKEMAKKASDKQKEIAREIKNEMRFIASFSEDQMLRMDAIIDLKKAWTWLHIFASGGLSIAAGITFLVGAAASGPLGWAALAAAGVGFLGAFLFKSRSKKEAEARIRLEKNLRENVNELCDSLEKQMEEKLDELINSGIDELIKEFRRIHMVFKSLADIQRTLAEKIDVQILLINRLIVAEALKLIGADESLEIVLAVARIPGNTCELVLRDKTRFPNEHKGELYKIMSERIYYISEADSKIDLISRIFQRVVDKDQIIIREEKGIAIIPDGKYPANMIIRIRLAQQLSKLKIIYQ